VGGSARWTPPEHGFAMAYVSGFKHDIFVSYASVDNEADAQDIRWVSRFRKDLEIALRQRLGKDIKIFFDTADLHAYHQLEQLIADASDSAVFLALLSPSYVERKWPLEELKAFGAAVAGARGSGEPNRIVTVEIYSVEEAKLPPEIQNLKRTRFYYEDSESRTEFKLTPESASNVYNERVHQLAHQLVLLMRDLRDRRAAKETEATIDGSAKGHQDPTPPLTKDSTLAGKDSTSTAKDRSAGKGKRVLLAKVTDDLYDERQQVLSYLEDLGVAVVPDGEYPEGGAKFAAAVKADVEKADLFVQLLGKVKSDKPEDLRASEYEQAKSYAQFQYDAALRRGIPVLQWRHPDNRPDKVAPTNWDKQLLEGSEVRVMGLQEFQKEIRTAVERLSAPPPRPRKSGFSFINADTSDQDLANSLTTAFKDKGRTAFTPMYQGNAREIEQDLEENLTSCSGLLLVYGKASLAWVRAQLRRVNKLAAQREKQGQEPLRPVVLVAPPSPKDGIGGTGDFDTIDCLDGAAVARVQAMIEEQSL
jgi:hypothetical protein